MLFRGVFLGVMVLSLLGCESEPRSTLRAVDEGCALGEVLLDLREDGAQLFASVQPVPPFSDAPRTLLIRWVEPSKSKASPWAFEDTAVLEARFIPGSEALLVVTRDRELVVLDSRRASPLRLDSEVHPPLSISSDGRFLAYAQGNIPDLEIVRYDLKSRSVVERTKDMAPAWSPVLSDHGARLIFVSGNTGHPELWEMQGNRSVRLTDRQKSPIPFPSGPSAPIWSGNTLAFEDTTGVHLVSLEPLRLLRTVPGTLPVMVSRSQAFILQGRDGKSSRWMSFDGTEVVR